MDLIITEYQDSYWNYRKPFAIEDDPFEDLVKQEASCFGKQEPIPVPPPPPKISQRKAPKKQKLPKNSDVPSSYHQNKKGNGEDPQSFVSSETKGLKVIPKVVIHPILMSTSKSSKSSLENE